MKKIGLMSAALTCFRSTFVLQRDLYFDCVTHMNTESQEGDAGRCRGQSNQGRIETLRPRGVNNEIGTFHLPISNSAGAYSCRVAPSSILSFRAP